MAEDNSDQNIAQPQDGTQQTAPQTPSENVADEAQTSVPNRLQRRTRASSPPPPFLPWTRRMARQAIPLTIRRIMLPLPVNAR